MTASPAAPAAAPAGSPPPRWYTHGWNRVHWYRAARVAARPLPRWARLGLALALARVAWRRLPREREVVLANLVRVLPAATPAAREAVARALFGHFAVCFTDLVTTNREAGAARLLAGVDGGRHLDAALARGRGVIVVTAHLGNWELGGRLLAARVPRPIQVLMAPEADPAVARFLRETAGGVRFVTRTRPTDVLTLLAALRRGEIVAVQGDRALGEPSDRRVPFFGADAAFPGGPFVLGRAMGAPVLPAFCVLGADRRYTVRLGAPILVAGADDEARAMGAWVAALETAIRAHPEQWFNFFDAWGGAPAC